MLLTIALCSDQDAAVVEDELGRILAAEPAPEPLPEDVRSFQKYVKDVPAEVEEKRTFGFSKITRRKWQRGLHREVHEYVANLRRTPAVRYYLRNQNKTPISAGLLYVIVRLMVRDRRFSFVNPQGGGLRISGSAEGNSTPRDLGKAYWEPGLKGASTKVLDEVHKLINVAPSCDYDKEYAALGDTPKSWLLAMRLCIDDRVIQTLLDGSTPVKR